MQGLSGCGQLCVNSGSTRQGLNATFTTVNRINTQNQLSIDASAVRERPFVSIDNREDHGDSSPPRELVRTLRCVAGTRQS